MKFIFVYTCFITAIALQINLSAIGISAPIYIAVAAFSGKITHFIAFAISTFLSSFICDIVLNDEYFSAVFSSVPFIAMMYFFSEWSKKNKESQSITALFDIIPISIFHLLYFSFAFLFFSPDILRILISFPLSIFLSMIVFIVMSMISQSLDLKEPERMVFG